MVGNTSALAEKGVWIITNFNDKTLSNKLKKKPFFINFKNIFLSFMLILFYLNMRTFEKTIRCIHSYTTFTILIPYNSNISESTQQKFYLNLFSEGNTNICSRYLLPLENVLKVLKKKPKHKWHISKSDFFFIFTNAHTRK